MKFDYVIVGAGSAGCVLANRLSADAGASVCLIEAGPADRSALIHAPLGIAAIVPTRHVNWAFDTVPQPGLNGRVGYQPRGRTLGGSSSINAMVYMRGHRGDYDDWAALLGDPGWSYDAVLPWFRKSERNERGADAWHGAEGELNVADLRSPSPASFGFVEAAKSRGQRANLDFNAAEQEGVGLYQVTQKGGRRCSAAVAFLHPVAARPNLKVLVECRALRLVLDGERASGVEVALGRHRETVEATREVILAAGAFGSPQLLLLSGVGPRAEIERHGIALRHELPGVGERLQDHVDYVLGYKSRSSDLLGLSPRGAWKLTRAVFEYRARHTGLITSNAAEAGGFVKTRPELERPDVQLHFVISALVDHARKLVPGHGMSCHACVLRPKSSGRVTLASADPFAPPRIDPNFLAEEDDLATLLAGFKLTREIMASEPLAPWREREMHSEGVKSDDELAHILRQRADTIYHPVGSCRMGRDAMAVVDASLRVRGVQGLRVADGSVMPTLIGGNTNAPIIMIAEKAAEMILAEAR
ncbi:MAG TPA: GMC family oxidoreductase N-terminal domain-containing protein [Burkholderiales bacterium]|nr:GMC family oxidoreductase N-terminal domain-containing protein [Burkholderiales bacterium]